MSGGRLKTLIYLGGVLNSQPGQAFSRLFLRIGITWIRLKVKGFSLLFALT